MSKNTEIGHKGELIAIEYLKKAGYVIICSNYRFERYEIDIIAREGDTLVFIEVKARNSARFGAPEEAIDDRKIDHILECANHYIEDTQWMNRIRFDIITVRMDKGPAINHIRDAFF